MTGRRTLTLALAFVIAGCGGAAPQPQWSDSADVGGTPVIDPVTVVEGDVWRFDVGLEPDDTGEPAGPCLQAIVADQPLGCIRIDPEPGAWYGFTAVARAGDERVIWQVNTGTDEDRPADHYVVWSNTSPDGRRLDPIAYGDTQSLLWIMEAGEAPWGYQVIAPDGTLVTQQSYVGLPGE